MRSATRWLHTLFALNLLAGACHSDAMEEHAALLTYGSGSSGIDASMYQMDAGWGSGSDAPIYPSDDAGWGSGSDAAVYEVDAGSGSDAGMPEQCDNGVDDDGDSFVDCSDTDCQAYPACIETNCTDGYDNDTDGLVDCGDLSCTGDPACLPCGTQAQTVTLQSPLFHSADEIYERRITPFDKAVRKSGVLLTEEQTRDMMLGAAPGGVANWRTPILHANGVVEIPEGLMALVDAHADRFGETGARRKLRYFEGVVLYGLFNPDNAGHRDQLVQYLGMAAPACDCQATCYLVFERGAASDGVGTGTSDCARYSTKEANHLSLSSSYVDCKPSVSSPSGEGTASASMTASCSRTGKLYTTCDFVGDCDGAACHVFGGDSGGITATTTAARDGNAAFPDNKARAAVAATVSPCFWRPGGGDCPPLTVNQEAVAAWDKACTDDLTKILDNVGCKIKWTSDKGFVFECEAGIKVGDLKNLFRCLYNGAEIGGSHSYPIEPTKGWVTVENHGGAVTIPVVNPAMTVSASVTGMEAFGTVGWRATTELLFGSAWDWTSFGASARASVSAKQTSAIADVTPAVRLAGGRTLSCSAGAPQSVTLACKNGPPMKCTAPTDVPNATCAFSQVKEDMNGRGCTVYPFSSTEWKAETCSLSANHNFVTHPPYDTDEADVNRVDATHVYCTPAGVAGVKCEHEHKLTCCQWPYNGKFCPAGVTCALGRSSALGTIIGEDTKGNQWPLTP